MKNSLHSLLKRQLKRSYGKSFDLAQLPEQEQQFINLVSSSYTDFKDELKFSEHTIDINSKELNAQNRSTKKALQSLAEAQRITKTGSWVYTLSNHHLEWSDELFRIFGLKPGAIQPSIEFSLSHVHLDDITKTDPTMQFLQDGTTFDAVYRLRLDSGEVKFVHDHREPILNAEGTPVAVRGTLQNITTQKKAEESLQLYANVFHNSGEAILLTDSRRRIIAVNTAFTKVTGYSIEDVLGCGTDVLSDGSVTRDMHKDILFKLSKYGFWQDELTGKRKDGEIYSAEMSISVSYNEAGKAANYIGIFADISERKSNQARIYHLAHHDTLTGLINRFSLEERLEQAMNTAQRSNKKVALLFLDMDRFKKVNDTLGHSVGDTLLIEVAHRLTKRIRNSDIVARLGGDEFIVVLTDIENPQSIAPTIQSIMDDLSKPYILGEHKVFSSPSIGISIYPTDADNCDDLMKHADSAMYHAKDAGRGNYQFFTESLNIDAQARLTLEHDVRFAIEHEQFELFYQPKINAQDGKPCGVEALVRWQHPEQGIIPPIKFIPIAEETKLIVPLGMWILEEACRQQQAWKKDHQQTIKMAVNLSAQQLDAPNLVQDIQSIMEKYHIPKGDLELEITESTVMNNPDDAIKILCEIRDLGIDLSIDDFGTGYSSLAYLKILPITTLKLDRIFVSEIEKSSEDAAISLAALGLAHNLGLNIVAEGVETKAQQDFLVTHGFDILQGYYFSKPLPANDVEDLLFNRPQ